MTGAAVGAAADDGGCRALRERDAEDVPEQGAHPLRRDHLSHRKVEDQRDDAGSVLHRPLDAFRERRRRLLAAGAAAAAVRPVLGDEQGLRVRQAVHLAGGVRDRRPGAERGAAAGARSRNMVDDPVGRLGPRQRAAAMARLAARLAAARLAAALRLRLGQAVARQRLAGVPAVLAEPAQEFGQLLLQRGDLRLELRNGPVALGKTRVQFGLLGLQLGIFRRQRGGARRTLCGHSRNVKNCSVAWLLPSGSADSCTAGHKMSRQIRNHVIHLVAE